MPWLDVKPGAAGFEPKVAVFSWRVTWRLSAVAVEGHNAFTDTLVQVHVAVGMNGQLPRSHDLSKRGCKQHPNGQQQDCRLSDSPDRLHRSAHESTLVHWLLSGVTGNWPFRRVGDWQVDAQTAEMVPQQAVQIRPGNGLGFSN